LPPAEKRRGGRLDVLELCVPTVCAVPSRERTPCCPCRLRSSIRGLSQVPELVRTAPFGTRV
jgi:hypothetical protein